MAGSLSISPEAFNAIVEASPDPKDKKLFEFITKLQEKTIEKVQEQIDAHPELAEKYEVPGAKIIMPAPRTQKALGVFELAKKSFGFNTTRSVIFQTETDEHLQDSEVMERIVKSRLALKKGEELFIRFCPKKPRHGFIDSYKYKFSTTSALVKEIIKSIRTLNSVDAEGELLVMKYIQAVDSAVITPGRIVVGNGHDGATVGKGVLSLSVPNKIFPVVDPEKFGIAKGEDPYFEVVIPKEDDRLIAVQVRSGPKISAFSGSEWIPSDVTVQDIVKAEGSLIDWQNRMERAGKSSGVVVFHPGGSISSHYSAHALLNKVPVFLAQPPVIGKRYSKTTNASGFDQSSIPDLVKGVMHGLSLPVSPKQEYGRQVGALECEAAVVATHTAPNWGTSQEAQALGAAAALMYRVSAAACIGEHRYKDKSLLKTMGPSRHEIYGKALANVDECVKRIRASLNSFANEEWGGAFGGIRWAECNAYTINLEDILFELVTGKQTSLDSIKQMLKIMHGIVYISHNNGKFLTKYVNGQFLDDVSTGGTPRIVSAVRVLRRALNCKVDEDTINKFVKTKRPDSETMKFWSDGKWITPPTPKKNTGKGSTKVKKAEAKESKKEQTVATLEEKNLTAQFRFISDDSIRIQVSKDVVMSGTPKKKKKPVVATATNESAKNVPLNVAIELGLSVKVKNKDGDIVPFDKSGHYLTEFQKQMTGDLLAEHGLVKNNKSKLKHSRYSMVSGPGVPYIPANVVKTEGGAYKITVKLTSGNEFVLHNGQLGFSKKG